MGAGPKWSPSDIMKHIKGGTSKEIREQFPDLEEVYWVATFLAGGFMVKPVGEINDKVISAYVRNQS